MEFRLLAGNHFFSTENNENKYLNVYIAEN